MHNMSSKQELRKHLICLLKDLSADSILQQSKGICDALYGLPQVSGCKAIAVFVSMHHEVQTAQFIDHCLATKDTVFIPKVTGPTPHDMKMLQLSSSCSLGSFPKNKWGIPEPPDNGSHIDGLVDGKIEVVVVPGVGFDRNCHRLGYGKGYYDCFIQRLAETRSSHGLPPPILIGVGFEEQIVDVVPVSEHDQALDMVVTPSERICR